MTKPELITSIRCVLEQRMGMTSVPNFGEGARLNEELRLDSVLLLQLLLHLELDIGFQIPEEALTQKHLVTVGSLADFLLGVPTEKPGSGRRYE